ncbi:MAG: hypothetical protein D6765_12405, partial [Bacteroidetes bacterium]
MAFFVSAFSFSKVNARVGAPGRRADTKHGREGASRLRWAILLIMMDTLPSQNGNAAAWRLRALRFSLFGLVVFLVLVH